MTKGSLNSKVEFSWLFRACAKKGGRLMALRAPVIFVQRRKLDQVMVSGKAVRVALPLTGFEDIGVTAA